MWLQVSMFQYSFLQIIAYHRVRLASLPTCWYVRYWCTSCGSWSTLITVWFCHQGHLTWLSDPIFLVVVAVDFTDDGPNKLCLVWLIHILVKIHGIFVHFGVKGYWLYHLFLSGVFFLRNFIIEVLLLCGVWGVTVFGIFFLSVFCLPFPSYLNWCSPKAIWILLLYWYCVFFLD